MRRTLKRGLVLAATVGVVTLGGGSAAMADDGGVTLPDSGTLPQGHIKNVGGGLWNYGTHATNGWSNYLHNSRCHGSSAVSGQHYDADHGVRKGNWAMAKVWRDGSATIKAFWTNSC